MAKETDRKLRQDLTPKQREQAERIGEIGNRSARYKSLATVQAKKFIPSKDHH